MSEMSNNKEDTGILEQLKALSVQLNAIIEQLGGGDEEAERGFGHDAFDQEEHPVAVIKKSLLARVGR